MYKDFDINVVFTKVLDENLSKFPRIDINSILKQEPDYYNWQNLGGISEIRQLSALEYHKTRTELYSMFKGKKKK